MKLDEELDEINRAPALSMPLCLALSAALLFLPRARSLLSRSLSHGDDRSLLLKLDSGQNVLVIK